MIPKSHLIWDKMRLKKINIWNKILEIINSYAFSASFASLSASISASFCFLFSSASLLVRKMHEELHTLSTWKTEPDSEFNCLGDFIVLFKFFIMIYFYLKTPMCNRLFKIMVEPGLDAPHLQ